METKIKTAQEAKEQMNTSIRKKGIIESINQQIVPENYHRVLDTNEFAFNINLPYHLPLDMMEKITSELEETWNIIKFNNNQGGHCFLQIQFKEKEAMTAVERVINLLSPYIPEIFGKSRLEEKEERELEIEKLQFEVRNPPLYSLGQEIMLSEKIKLMILEERIHVEKTTGVMERRLQITIDHFHILPKYMNRYQENESERDKLGIEIAEKELRGFIKKIGKEA